MQALLKKSKSLRQMISDHKVRLVGAMHNIETGKISFKSPYPERIDHNMYTTSKITSNPIW